MLTATQPAQLVGGAEYQAKAIYGRGEGAIVVDDERHVVIWQGGGITDAIYPDADITDDLWFFPESVATAPATLPTNAGTDELIANLPNAAAVWVNGRAAMAVMHDDSTRRLYVEWGANGDAPTTREWVSYDVVQTTPLVRNGITRCPECGSQYHVDCEGGHVCDDGYDGMTFNAAQDGASHTLTTTDPATPANAGGEEDLGRCSRPVRTSGDILCKRRATTTRNGQPFCAFHADQHDRWELWIAGDDIPEHAPGIVGWDLRYTDPGNCIVTPADWEPYPVLVECPDCDGVGCAGYVEHPTKDGVFYPEGICPTCGGSGYVWHTEL